MAAPPRMPFLPGVPEPVLCQLPAGSGGIGSERECVSRQGTVRQRILEWVPEKRVSFRMERTDLGFRSLVDEMVDTIDLVPRGAGVDVTRTTQIRVKGRFRFAKGWLVLLGVKQVHRYVFRNWLASSG
jgi:polyketide cyclase/dehydrase/lipid transport protein